MQFKAALLLVAAIIVGVAGSPIPADIPCKRSAPPFGLMLPIFVVCTRDLTISSALEQGPRRDAPGTLLLRLRVRR